MEVSYFYISMTGVRLSIKQQNVGSKSSRKIKHFASYTFAFKQQIN